MPRFRLLASCLIATVLAGPAFAQRARGFDDQQTVAPPNTTYQGNQGFSFQGDEVPPSHDRPYVGKFDPRYGQTYQQQQEQAQRQPGGGCLRYGAVGAAGGHLAGHGVLGALAGCAVGRIVRNRDKAAIAQQQQQQAPR